MENHPDNEPILNYGPGSKEKKELKIEIERQKLKKLSKKLFWTAVLLQSSLGVWILQCLF